MNKGSLKIQNKKNKNLIKIFNKSLLTYLLINLLTIFAFQTPAEAQVLSSAEIKSQIANQLEAIYNKNTNAEVEVKITATPLAELQLPDGKVTYKIVQGADRIVPRDIKRVDV